MAERERNSDPPGLDLRTLMEKLKSVDYKYFLIGINLGIDSDRIRTIEVEHKQVGRILAEVLDFWLNGNTKVPVCWDSVANVLRSIDNNKLADQITKENAPNKDCLALGLSPDNDSFSIMSSKFQTLVTSILNSFKRREVSTAEIIAQVRTFGYLDPVLRNPQDPIQPMLQHEIERLEKETRANGRAHVTFEDIHTVIMKYSSFFNYYIVEKMVEEFGTSEDKKIFHKYDCEFREYAEETIIKWPLQIAAKLVDADLNQVKIYVKVDDSFIQKYTLSHLKLFVSKLSKVLGYNEGVLQLVDAKSGCINLMFRIPLFVQRATFPLSLKQEDALAQLSVLELTSGTYMYRNCDQRQVPSADQSDENGQQTDKNFCNTKFSERVKFPSSMDQVQNKVHDLSDFSLHFTNKQPDSILGYSELDDQPRVIMSCGHAVDANSLTEWCLSLLNQRKWKFYCPAILQGPGSNHKQCNKTWEYIEVRKVAMLTNEERQYFESKISEYAAYSYLDYRECPGCHSFVERRDLTNVIVQCTICTNAKKEPFYFCWNCNKEWKGPITFDSSLMCGNPDCYHPSYPAIRDAEMVTLNGMQVPQRRACPTCGSVIEHKLDGGCKFIICPRCKKEFCFLCLLLKSECLESAPGSNYTECNNGVVAPKQTQIPVPVFTKFSTD